MQGDTLRRAHRLAAALLAAGLVAALSAPGAGATLTTIYNNIPSPLPGNVPSEAFEAQSASEWGGQVEFAAGSWKNPVVQVTMSSWACQLGTWYEANCVTTAGAKFEWPVTIGIYEVGPGNSVGAKIAAGSRVFKMPYRPSASSKCTGEAKGGWYNGVQHACFHGKAFKIALALKVAKLPSRAIISVAFNTSDYGAQPQRPQPCDSTTAGCPYDSLNVGTAEALSVGAFPLPADAYLSSTWTGAYCDEGAGGTGSFRLDAGCWSGYQPAIAVKAAEG